MSNQKIIYVIDDDPAVRTALGSLLESNQRMYRLYASGREFLRDFSPGAEGCIVTDVRMPEISGIDLLNELVRLRCSLPVIVMTAFADIPLAIEVMKMGAADLLEKPFTNLTLLKAIDDAIDMSRDKVHRAAETRQVETKIDTLTGRERDVLAALLEGAPNKIIARQFDIHPRTVETHRAAVMEKMEAETLSELLRMCLRAEISPEGIRAATANCRKTGVRIKR